MHDYVPGKADWLARGLPTEGERPRGERAIDFVREDATTCRLEERIETVRARVEASPYGFALVVSAGGTLLGRLRKPALGSDESATVEVAMEPGPSTVRADMSLERLRERLDKRGFETAVVTTPDGVLLGVVRREDLPE